MPGGDAYFDYAIGATASTLLYEATYGGMSTFYKTTLWGLSSLCGFPKGLGVPNLGHKYSVNTSELGPEGDEFRRQAVVNTFAESAPDVVRMQSSNLGIGIGDSYRGREPVVSLSRFGDFYIGPDRVLLQEENW